MKENSKLKSALNMPRGFRRKGLQQKISEYRKNNLEHNNTIAVQAIANILDYAHIYYIREKGFVTPNSFVLVDFYLPKPYKTVIEVDGSSHIGKEGYDQWRDRYLKERKLFVVHMTNEETLSNIALNTLISRLEPNCRLQKVLLELKVNLR